ncbi:TetR/AcrR family transcriptional regulator [Amycolatopsis sp. cmx-4-61]|uniref:TetR/AcrR family transcriptional regulator n=1 Tax=Amycolatopsis sp. cmx-4-61 TaxID=2790937 RepID=UPI00397AAA9F
MSDAATRDAKAEDVRARMLDAAERLLIASDDHDISTRAVCDAIGVAQPILYRLFKDKNGLLYALVQNGFERYVQRKQALESTDDPVADLRAGWDDHMNFALTNGALYRLMFSPALPKVPEPAGRIFELLTRALDRCAAIGVLRIPSVDAAQAILSANVGVALSMLSQPGRYADPHLSHRVRDAVFAACLTLETAGRPVAGNAMTAPALQLEAQLQEPGMSPLEPEETALLLKWLNRIRTSPGPAAAGE